MRPTALIVLLVVLAAGLAGGLLFFGRGPTEPHAGSPTSERSRTEAPAPSIIDPDLDSTALEGRADLPSAPAVAAPAVAAAGAPAAAEAARVSVRGRVVGHLGRPIEGATVFAAETNGFDEMPLDEIAAGDMSWFDVAQAKTDADGRFEIRPAARSKFTLAVRAAGSSPLDREFALSGSERDVGELVLEPSLVLLGRVVDTGGRPVHGAKLARLSASGPGFAPFGRVRGALVAETDAQGAFRVDQLTPGEWRLSITHPRYPDLVQKGEGDRPGVVRSGLVFTMEDGATIHGRLVGAPEGAASKLSIRATIAPSGEGSEGGGPMEFRSTLSGSVRETPCAADGTFEIAGLQPGKTYRLTARDNDRTRFNSRSRSSPTTARAGDRGIEIAYRPQSALVFQVLDATSGDPVVDLTVRAGYGFSMPLLDEDGRAVRRFPEGRVRFGDLPGRGRGPGSSSGLELTVESPGYKTFERKDVALLEGQDTDLGVIRLERAPVVKVLVLDAANSAPIEGAVVSIAEQEGEGGFRPGETRFRMAIGAGDSDDDVVFAPGSAHRARTDADGRAIVTSLPGKTVLLSARHAGHAPHRSEPIVLPVAEDFELTVRLGAGGQVIVEVVDNRGTPVSGVEIDHQGPNDDPAQHVLSSDDGRTDADGMLAFEHLTPGEHRFRLRGAQTAGFVSVGGRAARMNRITRRGDGAQTDEGWSSATVVEGESQTLKLIAPARGSLSGRITEGGQPLANAELRLVPADEAEEAMPMPFGGNGREAKTDGRGEYLLDGVDEGEYRLEVRHASRAMPHDAATRVREGENELNLDLPVAIVEGRITGKDEKPLAGIRVRAERATSEGPRRSFSFVMVMDDGGDEPEVSVGAPGGGTSVTTDAEGRYTLRGVVPEVDLVVSATGKEVQPGKSEPFRVAIDGIKKHVDFSLEDGGSIEITVRRAGNGPAGRYMARATPAEGGEPKIQMVGPGGSARITGLKPGRWNVVLDPLMGLPGAEGETQSLEQEVEVVVGKAAKATFDSP